MGRQHIQFKTIQSIKLSADISINICGQNLKNCAALGYLTFWSTVPRQWSFIWRSFAHVTSAKLPPKREILWEHSKQDNGNTISLYLGLQRTTWSRHPLLKHPRGQIFNKSHQNTHSLPYFCMHAIFLWMQLKSMHTLWLSSLSKQSVIMCISFMHNIDIKY